MSKPKGTMHKPGQKAPRIWTIRRSWSKRWKTGAEVTVTKGETLPPTPKPGQGFILVDKTKHKDDK